MNSESSSTSTKLKIRPPDWMRKRGVPLDLAKKMCDPFWYIPRMKIVDKQGRRRPIKNLHPAQKEILHAMVNNRNVCILKARQVGASTIVTAFFCWLALIQDEIDAAKSRKPAMIIAKMNALTEPKLIKLVLIDGLDAFGSHCNFIKQL